MTVEYRCEHLLNSPSRGNLVDGLPRAASMFSYVRIPLKMLRNDQIGEIMS